MGAPPRFDELDEVSFIVNYFVQGCVPPYELFVEFSREPQKDMWLLLLGLDPVDIAKDWLKPYSGRKRKPARHGRKHPLRRLSLDPNEYLGSRARANAGPYPGITLPGAKAVFKIWDQIDRLNFTAAVVEGLTDIGFETLWGILTAHPEHCPNMAFLQRHDVGPFAFPGVLQPQQPFDIAILDAAQLFTTLADVTWTTFSGPWTMCYSCEVEAVSTGGAVNWRLDARSQDRGIVESTGARTWDRGERQRFTISAEFAPGEFASISRRCTSGTVNIYNQQLFCFKGNLL